MKQTAKAFSRFGIFSATLGGAAFLLALAQLGSRGLGLVRDRVLATGLGTTGELDVYYAAFRIPDFLFNVLIAGAISAAFIPIFAGYLAKNQTEEANRVGSAIITIALAVLVVAAGIVFLFAPQIMPVVTPGFNDLQLEQVIVLTRIMLLSPILFGLSGIFGSILNSHHRFIAYSIAPLCYNLGIIAGALLAPHYGIVWLAVGVVLGAALQMLVQFAGVLKTGFRYRPRFDLHHPGVRRIFILMVPATIGLSIVQINWLFETIIATTLREGSLSQFSLASSLAMLPVGVVGASFATAVFPILAKAASQRKTGLFVSSLVDVIRRIMYFVIPATIAMMVLRAQIVRLIYGAGKFDFTATRYVTSLLGILAVSLFAQALIPLLTRAFYALRNTKTPVYISSFAMILNIILAFTLSYYLGVVGLALALSIASIIQLALLFFFLSAKVPEIEDTAMISAIVRILGASLLMGLAMYSALYLVAYLAEGLAREYTVLYFVIQAGVSSLAGLVVYLFVTTKLDLPEARTVVKRLPFFRRSA